MQRIYLSNVPLAEAQESFLEKVSISRKIEKVRTEDALRRITASPVYAKRSMPAFRASAMDGIAVKSQKTYGADEQNPVILNIDQDFVQVDTGDPIANDFDAVIMIEDINWLNNNQVEIYAAASPWQYIRPVGEDVVAGEILVTAHHKLSPPDLGVLLAGGILEVDVFKKPDITVIPTGTELIKPNEEIKPGKIVDFNSTVLKAYLNEWGAEVERHSIVKDNKELIKNTVKDALKESDVIIVNAGSSAGTEDYTSEVIGELGEVYIHGVATKPGKPVILGEIDKKPVIGIPGYPVSAYLALEWFVKPLLEKYYGVGMSEKEEIEACLGKRVVSTMGKEEFVRMTVGKIDGKYVSNPLNRGAGVTMSLVKAHGILRIPANSLGYERSETVKLELIRRKKDLENTILITGSHDLTIDLLENQIRKTGQKYFISSSHVGSMGGLLAIQNKECHGAGMHLLDTESGEYNIPYIEKYLKNNPDLVLVNLVHRDQGLIVPKGNPKGIYSVEDIIKKEAMFINRQKGAGTRILFDNLLTENNIESTAIKGYNHEEFSHLGVAAAIKSGTVDVGAGIKSAAIVYGLDFIPLARERYDLLFHKSFLDSAAGYALLQIINSTDFQEQVHSLGGYGTEDTGKIIWQSCN